MSMNNKEQAVKVESWSVRRWKQLEAMRRILFECQSLNTGNGIIERINFLVAESKKLTNGDRRIKKDTDRAFIHFLEEQAIEGYKAKKKRRSKHETGNRA